MTPERKAEIRAALDVAANFSPGAFWGFLLHEKGFELEEVLEVGKEDALTFERSPRSP